jgi:twinkle protein
MAVDSLMKCVGGEDDYNGQKLFIENVTAIARDTGMHVHVVHHARKGGDEFAPPGKMDAKGSGSITDQVDNVLVVWRNKKKEIAVRDGKTSDSPDAMLICEKQRNGDSEPRIGLWFDQSTMQYVANSGDAPQNLMVWGSERRLKSVV